MSAASGGYENFKGIRPSQSLHHAASAGRDQGREPISCRSCRQRKIKCSRKRPTCQSCQIYQCDCIYDAVPQKKGPKAEVLKQMLKRIDELERRLSTKEQTDGPTPVSLDLNIQESRASNRRRLEPGSVNLTSPVSVSPLPVIQPGGSQVIDYNQILDVFFQNFHGNPYSFLHEATTRQQLVDNQLDPQLLTVIHALSTIYMESNDTRRRSKCEELASLARQQLDLDEPSLPNIQTAILLSLAYFLLGYGKKCWMQLGIAIRMSQALSLQRELPAGTAATPLEREIARRCFWTCYIMDRLNVSGSQRPCSTTNESVALRMPCKELSFHQGCPETSPLFQHSVLHFAAPFESAGAMFVDVTRILGIAIQYLQQGGVKGDSHFPWHPQSILSQIRNELKTWAFRISVLTANTALTTDNTTATIHFLSQCIYHHIFVLIYRPFLPFSLSELKMENGSMNKAWQTEVVNLCLQHAIFIADLEHSRLKHGGIKQPPYLSYCLMSAATVFIHGAHYSTQDASKTLERLVTILEDLGEMRKLWRSVDFQYSTLRNVFIYHSKLIEQYTSDGQYPSCVHLDDFFDRYPGVKVDPGYVQLSNPSDWTSTIYEGSGDIFSPSRLGSTLESTYGHQDSLMDVELPSSSHALFPNHLTLFADSSGPQTSENHSDSTITQVEPEFQSLSSLFRAPFEDSTIHSLPGSETFPLDSPPDLDLFEHPRNSSDPLTEFFRDLDSKNIASEGTEDFRVKFPDFGSF